MPELSITTFSFSFTGVKTTPNFITIIIIIFIAINIGRDLGKNTGK